MYRRARDEGKGGGQITQYRAHRRNITGGPISPEPESRTTRRVGTQAGTGEKERDGLPGATEIDITITEAPAKPRPRDKKN